jgi:lysophospholipase L1-like esterase
VIIAQEKKYAEDHCLGSMEFCAVLAGPDGGFPLGLTPDGIHPNEKAHNIIAPIVPAP